MRLLAATVLLFALFASDAALSGRAVLPGQAEVSDEYLVWDAVIGDVFADSKTAQTGTDKIRVKQIVIKDRTVAYPRQGLSSDQNLGTMLAPSLHPEMFADYRAKNQQPATLTRQFELKVDYAMLNVLENQLKSKPILVGNGMNGSYIVGLSQVGFNKAHSEALVYMDYVCGGLCGEGIAFFLEKENDAWKVSKRSMLWIS
jgi:hypothetical protein